MIEVLLMAHLVGFVRHRVSSKLGVKNDTVTMYSLSGN